MKLNNRLTEFEKRKVKLVGISMDSPRILNLFTERRDIGFTLLSDEGAAIIKAFDLFNGRYSVAHPAIILVDPKGTVRAVLREQNYQDRPTIDQILSAIDQHLAQ